MADAESPLVRFRLWYALLPPALRVLLTVNGVLYVAWLVLRFVPVVAAFATAHLALTPLASVVLREPWQLLTHPFLNLKAVDPWGFISVLFALAWLNWMGRDYEESYGGHRLFGLYVMAGVWGALLAVAYWTLRPLPTDAVLRSAPLIAGTWAPAIGVICAVATLHPNRGIGLFLLGVVPLKWLAIGIVVLDLVFGFSPEVLGAALVGFGFAKAQQRDVDLAAWAKPIFERKPRPARRAAPVRTTGASKPSRRWFGGEGGPQATRVEPRPAVERRPAAARPGHASQAEVDRILDKINDAGGGERGMAALTDEERRILEEASRRS